MSLFDERDMAAITSPDFPGERLIVCRNPDLARERARKREDLIKATERDLAELAAGVARNNRPLRGAAKIGVKVGAVLDKHKMAKHFELTIADDHIAYRRKTNQIADEATLDGLYAVRTSLSAETLDDAASVRAYKSFSMVERAFRCLKTVDLHIRPIHHWLEDRVRAHVFLCMLAYYLEWSLRARLAPMLYDDGDREAAEASRASPVAKAQRSTSALAESAAGRTADGAPVHSFQTLLADLATLARNTIVTAIAPDRPFIVLTRPTPIQQKAFDLLAIPIACTQ
jgi:transposase